MRLVLGPQDSRVRVRIFVKEALDVASEGLEGAREREEAGRRVEYAEETCFEDFLEFLLSFEKLQSGLVLAIGFWRGMVVEGRGEGRGGGMRRSTARRRCERADRPCPSQNEGDGGAYLAEAEALVRE